MVGRLATEIEKINHELGEYFMSETNMPTFFPSIAIGVVINFSCSLMIPSSNQDHWSVVMQRAEEEGTSCILSIIEQSRSIGECVVSWIEDLNIFMV